MKFRYLLIVVMVFLFCKKEAGTTSSYTRMEPITLKVEVKDSNDQPFTDGFIRMDALVGLDHPFGGWYLEGREDTNALNEFGFSNFVFGTNEIAPGIGGIFIRNLEVLDRSFQQIYEDTTDFFIESGQTMDVEFIVQ
ncbi:hypothetical protein ACFL4T_10785 [candidate division KSB1 bacterium]